MILVDTSIWIDHLRSGNTTLTRLLEPAKVLAHPFVIGETTLSHLRQRNGVLDSLVRLPQATVATDAETRHFIDHHAQFGRDIGYVDAHLLAAVRLTADARLWTADKRLHGVADTLGLAMAPP